MKCVQIGFGKIARIHQDQFESHGVHTVGVVDIDPNQLREIAASGLRAFGSLPEAIACKPDFYDICTPGHARVEVLRVLSALDPQANILIEKPICDFKDIQSIQDILQDHLGRIAVNENYASSNVTVAVRNEIAARGIPPARLIIESTKHRGTDNLNGRYLDTQLGALGYEGTHLLAIVGEFGSGYQFDKLLDSDIDNIQLDVANANQGDNDQPSIVGRRYKRSLSHQGGAFMQYKAHNGCIVDLYTSMSGIIGFPCPPHAYPEQRIPQSDTHTRYRIVRVDGVDAEGIPHQIVGFYEPIAGFERSQAQVLIFQNWILQDQLALFEDNTMSQHLFRIVRYFGGFEQNPYGVARALADVTSLHEWSQTCWYDMEDSDEFLGREDVADARLQDARRFQL